MLVEDAKRLASHPTSCSAVRTHLDKRAPAGQVLAMAAQVPDQVLAELVVDEMGVVRDALGYCARPPPPVTANRLKAAVAFVQLRRDELARAA